MTRRTLLSVPVGVVLGPWRYPAFAQTDSFAQASRSCRIGRQVPAQGDSLLRVDGGCAVSYVASETYDPNGPNVWLWGPDGQLRWQATVFPKGSLRGLIWNVAARATGDAVVASSFVDMTGRMAHSLCVVGEDGAVGDFIRTNPFSPREVCFGPGDSIWTLGRNIEAENEGRDHDLFARYDTAGSLLNTLVPRSTFADGTHPTNWGGRGKGVFIRASADRIGAYLGRAEEWLEFSPDGSPQGRWNASTQAGRAVTSVALTDSPGVFAWQHKGAQSGLYQFDHANSQWVAVEETLGESQRPALGPLLGSDGDQLVLRSGWTDPDLVEWHDAPHRVAV